MRDDLRIEYATLCRISLLHDAWLSRDGASFERLGAERQATLLSGYDSGRLLQLRPTQEARRLLQRHALKLRSGGDGCAIAAQVQRNTVGAAASLARPLEPGFRLRLLLLPADPALLNYSNLALGSGTDFYRFGTQAANVDPWGAHLSAPLVGFDTTRRYAIGDVVLDDPAAPTARHTALRDTGPGPMQTADWALSPALPATNPGPFNPGDIAAGERILRDGFVYQALADDPVNDVNDAGAWQRLFPVSFQAVSATDRIELRAARYRVDVGAALVSSVGVELLDQQGRLRDQWRVSRPQPIRLLDIDLGRYPAGSWRVRLRGEDGRLLHLPATPDIPLTVADELVYADDEAVRSGAFGVIEIGADDLGYELINTDGSLAAPTFLLRLMSRPTSWRYHFPFDLSDEQIAAIPSTLTQDGSRSLLTTGTHPLGNDFVPLDRFDSGQLLPNPRPQQALKLVDGRLISDLYLNH